VACSGVILPSGIRPLQGLYDLGACLAVQFSPLCAQSSDARVDEQRPASAER